MPSLRPIPHAALCCTLLALLCAPFAQAAYERVQAPLDDDPMGVQIFRLENGLLVYITENHETPRFYTEISVRAGSKQDPAESTGLAHYLEHLLFKGSEHYGTIDYAQEKVHLDKIEELYEEHSKTTDPDERAAIYARINEVSQEAAKYQVPNELDRVYSAMGAQYVNAHTWHEETVYKVGLPSNRLEHWAVLEAERFKYPVFRLFQTELETVYEEKNRSLDNKDRIIYTALQEQLYKVHPYGQQPTIGTVEHLKNPSLKNIHQYYDTWYVPNNMAIFISGDVDTEECIEIIDKHFASWEAKPLPDQRSYEEPPVQGREEVVVTYQGEEEISIAFRTAPLLHEDAETLQLLDMILDNATAGLINLNLNQQQRVRAAGSMPEQYNDYGCQVLWGVPKEGQTLEEVEQLLLDQIEIIKRGEFEDWLIEAIVNDFKKNEKAGLESNLARVSHMRTSWNAFDEWEHAARSIDRMEEITKEDVVRVAQKYFGENYVVAMRKDAPHEVPDIAKPKVDPIDIDPSRESDFSKMLMAMPVEAIEPEFITEDDYNETTRNGVTYYHAENPVNDLFTLSIRVDMGTRHDNKLGLALGLLDKSGAGDMSSEDLKKEWYKLGTDFGAGAGENETVITLSGLDENFEASVELMMTLLDNPTADPSVLEEMKGIILFNREDARKQAPSIWAALVQYNRFGENSSELRDLPSEALKALTVEELHSLAQNLLGYKRTVSYTGSLSPRRVRRILADNIASGAELKDTPAPEYYTTRAPEQTQIYFIDKEVAQASIRLEFGSTNYDEAYAPAIELYNDYFAGGMGGIVFQELREARALAYSAGARYITAGNKGEQNIMAGIIQTQCDKTLDATTAFLDLLDNLPHSDDRFAVTLDSIESQYRTGKTGFRAILGAVQSWERLGLEPDPREARFATIQEAQPDKLYDFHQEFIAGKPKLISIVGDSTKIDMEALANLGEITTLEVEDVFVD